MNRSIPTGSRRGFIIGAGALLTAMASHRAVGQSLSAPSKGELERRLLIIFTLVGGNDSLNTLIPHADPLYRQFRPTIGLPLDQVLPLDDELALHPNLTQTMKMFQAGELAIIPDVGYPHPNLSHFESAAIWESAKPEPGLMGRTGWWSDLVVSNRAAFDAAQLDTTAISFEREAAFTNGKAVSVWRASQDVRDVLGTLPDLNLPAAERRGLARELADRIQLGFDTRARLVRRLQGARPPVWKPYEEPIDVQLRLTDWFLQHEVRAPVIRLVQDGFDTHSGLRTRHDARMKTVDHALDQLRLSLKSHGRWDDALVMVHSEFGRRPAENGYGGTDHGTGGPVLLAGGGVRGAVHGLRADLNNLDQDGNPRFTTDFRSLYSTIAGTYFKLSANPFADSGFTPLPNLLA